MKSFNITGTCRPNEHYIVDITERLEIIRGMVSKANNMSSNSKSGEEMPTMSEAH